MRRLNAGSEELLRLLAVWITVFVASAFSQNDPATFPVYSYYPALVNQAKLALGLKDSSFIASYNQIIHDADSVMTLGPWSVMDKTTVAASGNKHDFYGIGIYLWPDLTKKDSLPYVSLDGDENPATQGPAYDDNRHQTMQACVEMLGIAYFFTGNVKYAQRIDTLVKVWYVDTATRMTPNMNYAQAWPGVATGRAEGIIGSRNDKGVLEAIGMIKGSSCWATKSDDTLTKWFTNYLTWLTTNSMALQEKAATNNHGTWWDVQAAYYALYLGQTSLATQILTNVKNRINTQIESSGLQPLEATRTRPMHYFCFNLQAFFILARLAEFVNVDLWNYVGPQGQSLKKALDFIAPYADSSKHWSNVVDTSVVPFDYSEFMPMLRIGTLKWGGTYYEQQIKKLPNPNAINSLRDFTMWYLAPPTLIGAGRGALVPAPRSVAARGMETRYYSLAGKLMSNDEAALRGNGVVIRSIVQPNGIVTNEKYLLSGHGR